MFSTLPSTLESKLNSSPIDTFTIPLSNSLALRAYSDTRPHNWKTADLQKGLILVHNGTEMVGEGTGFGVPILIYANETYFSASAIVCLSRQENLTIIRKEFLMDRIARNRFRSVSLENRKARAILRYIAALYQRHRRLRFLALKGLIGEMDVHSGFVKTIPAGEIIVTYIIGLGRIQVKADFSLLKRENLQRISLLNEQSSRFFRKYLDSDKAELTDGQIGAWDTIRSEWACLTDLQGRFGFRLWQADNSVLRMGREFLKDSLDWVGLDYEIDPRSTVAEYEIEILGV